MVNDTTTLNGALQELGETMAANLTQQGVTSSASEGLTTLAGKILDIQTGGGSCYKIEFSEDSYTAVGGSATLEIYLQENYQPKSGATVTVTGSDSSLYSGITDNSGVATVTVTVNSDTTFTASYSNVSANCTVTVPTYLFYDDCSSSSGLDQYGASKNFYGGSQSTATLSYDSTENAYLYEGTGRYCSIKPITALLNKDNYKITITIKHKSTNALCQPALYFFNNTETRPDVYGIRHMGNGSIQAILINGNNQGATTYASNSYSTGILQDYFTLSLIKQGTTYTFNEYDKNGNQIFTYSREITALSSNIAVGLAIWTENTSVDDYYIKEIKAESL